MKDLLIDWQYLCSPQYFDLVGREFCELKMKFPGYTKVEICQDQLTIIYTNSCDTFGTESIGYILHEHLIGMRTYK